TLRGIAGSEKFIIMQNGVRITPPTGDPYSMGAQFSLANAKRVEIILGPASALYGADAFSGIINIITNDARDTKGGTVNTSYGQYATGDHSIVLGSHTRDLGFTVTAQVTHSREPDYYNIYPESFSWYNDHYKPDGTVDINGNPEATPVSFDRSFEMPTRSYYLDAKANFGDFEIGALAMHERHSSSVSVDPRYSLYTKDAFIATQLQSGYARHVHTGKDDRWSLQSYISFCNTRMDPESNFINRFTGYEQGYKYQASQSQKIEEQWDYELTRNASVIAGFSIEDHSVLPKTADLPRAFNPKVPAAYQQIPYINTDTTDYLGNSLVIYQDFYYLHYQNYGTFAQLYNKWKWVELTVGGRFDYNTRFKSVFNPRMGLVVKPKDNLKLKLLYGQSFLAPSPWKAYSTYGSFQPVSDSLGQITGLESPFFHIPNPDLKPEKLQSLEGGVAFYKGKNFSAFADVYYNTISNLINIQSASTQTSFRGVSVTYAETANNEGVANTYGATFSGNYFLNLGEHRFNLYGSYSYSNGKIDGEPLVLSAMHTGKAGIDWTLGKWSASLRTLHRSASNSVLTKTSGDYYTSPAYTIYNLNARYALASQKHYELQLTLGIRNLTNVKYYNAAAGQDSFTITPQDPIRVCLGANLQFKP
ncbi:MAG: TonB-dependent receptor, partial [Flavobacteriales bacterium]|nr:TonB-dependent receptor [Flavobacteriales bacterium]